MKKTPTDGWDKDERDALAGAESALDELRARHANDPPIELLRAARADVLPTDLQADANSYLAQSAWSRALVDGAEEADISLDVEEQDRILRRIKVGRARAAEPRWPWRQLWQPVLASGALVMVAASAWVFWREAPAQQSTQPPEAQVAIATPPSSPTFLLALEKPDVKVSPGALTFRGPGGENRLLTDLKPALDAFRADDYAAADSELSTLAGRYPMSVEIPYYQGVSRLFLNDPAGAMASLSEAERLADSSFAGDVAWYRAVAEERAGKKDDARARLDALCKQPGPRSPAACAAEPRMR